MIRLRRHPLIDPIFSQKKTWDWLLREQENLHLVLLINPGASRYFSLCNCLRIPCLCRVLQSSEPAFAGRDPTRQFRLGQGLSRHCREIGSLFVGVGSERRCSIASTAGHIFYTIKSDAGVGKH